MHTGQLGNGARDAHRPRYHFLPPANWMNDPNGPIFFDGRYHVFYQHNPNGAFWGTMHWGHAVSRDLVHWEHWPIALAPGPTGPDKDGCFSGCCVVHHGVPTIIYTGVNPQVQCLATSRDGMRTWHKRPGNPVIPGPPPGLDVEGFRDPFAWQAGAWWYVAIGSGLKGVGGTVLLYRSRDLVDWEYIQPLCVGDKTRTGTMWECPNFYAFGEKHLLAVSPFGKVQAMVGTYADHTFTPEIETLMDLSPMFYAPNSLVTPDGRRIVWGYIQERRSEEARKAAGWAGVMSLPREVFLHADGALGMVPARELAVLRGTHWRATDRVVRPGEACVSGDLAGDRLEIIACIDCDQADAVGLHVRRAPDGSEQTTIEYSEPDGRLTLDGTRSSLSPDVTREVVGGSFRPPGDQTLRLHVFLDDSVVEVFANDRACLTERIYPTRPDSLMVDVFSHGGTATLRSLDAWRMESIW